MPGRNLLNLFALLCLLPIACGLLALAGCTVTGSLYVEHKQQDTTAGSSVHWTLSPRKE